MNSSFICHIREQPSKLSSEIALLDANGWPAIISNDLGGEDIKTRMDVIFSSTWGLYFAELSVGATIADLELGVLLSSPICKMIALIGVLRPFNDYLWTKKVICYSDWANFRARMFIP